MSVIEPERVDKLAPRLPREGLTTAKANLIASTGGSLHFAFGLVDAAVNVEEGLDAMRHGLEY